MISTETIKRRPGSSVSNAAFRIIVVSAITLFCGSLFAENVSLGKLIAQQPVAFSDFLADTMVEQQKKTVAVPEVVNEDKQPVPAEIVETEIPKHKLGDLLAAEVQSFDHLVSRFTGQEIVPEARPQLIAKSSEKTESIQISVTKDGRTTKSKKVKVGAVKVATPAKGKIKDSDIKMLELIVGGEKLRPNPEALLFSKAGEAAKISIRGEEAGFSRKDLSVFVRDENVVHWNQRKGLFEARALGKTEIYIVGFKDMVIVPASVGEKINAPELEIPDELLALDKLSVLDKTNSASYSTIEEATQSSNEKETSVSIDDSAVDAAAAAAAQSADQKMFFREDKAVQYTALELQVIDDRSDYAGSQKYPVGGAKVHIVGTEFTQETDGSGRVFVNDIPTGSRFLILVDDPHGRVRPGIFEVSTNEDSKQSLRVMRDFPFQTYQELIKTVQHNAYGSMCATVADAEGPMDSVEVSLNVNADGPFYFNRVGVLDSRVTESTQSGRFCFFNIDPGPAAISITDSENSSVTVPVVFFAGRHVEDRYLVDNGREVTTSLGMYATAPEQLSADQSVADRVQPVDMIQLLPLGDYDSHLYIKDGLLSSADDVLFHKSRFFALSDGAEFESVLYSYESENDDDTFVTPLIPRGFVEDMSLYAQVPYDPSLGVVISEHSVLKGQGDSSVNFRLVSAGGRDVGDGWYYSDEPSTKAIFFNLEPGLYSLIVETSEGYWLSAKTVLVYNETVSFVQTGSQLFRKKLPK